MHETFRRRHEKVKTGESTNNNDNEMKPPRGHDLTKNIVERVQRGRRILDHERKKIEEGLKLRMTHDFRLRRFLRSNLSGFFARKTSSYCFDRGTHFN